MALPVAPQRHVTGVLTAPAGGDLREVAHAYVLAHREKLGLPATSSLGPAQAFSTRFGGSVHFAQRVGGVEVDGARVIVTFDLQGRVVRVASSLVAYQQLMLRWNLTGPQAVLAGARELDGALFEGPGLPRGGYRATAFPVGDALHAGYLVHVPTWNPAENWHLAIDATDGSVLWRQNRVHRGFEARVYEQGPGGLSAGVGVTPLVPVTLAGLRDGGRLDGERVRVFGCCPAAGCDLDAGAPARRATGYFRPSSSSAFAPYDVPICDPAQRASNDPAQHSSGDFVYAPVALPTGAAPNMQSAGDIDEFAEVHAYHHLNKAYGFIRGLSLGPLAADGGFSPFQLRDEKRGHTFTVQVNLSETVFPQAPNAQGVWYGTALRRFEDAFFYASEDMVRLYPEHALQSDSIRLSQGDRADLAYDGTVMWHEFAHAAVYSTSHFNVPVAIDARSAMNENGALHEAIADAFAFMMAQDPVLGPYVGPRTGAGPRDFVRNADNTNKCPDSTWGDGHADSQYFSGALWQARETLFQGADQGRTFDAAFYAAVVSFPPDVGFDSAAAISSHAVGLAFPANPRAEAQMKQVFDARGVTGCSKVLELVGGFARPIYIVSSTADARVAMGSVLPGPYQLKLRAPRGAKSLTVRSNIYQGTTGIRVLAKVGQPITFKRASSQRLANDADRTVVPTFANAMFTTTIPLEVPCGGEVYFTVGNVGPTEQILLDLNGSIVAADSCPMPVPDAGPMPNPDAGTTTPDPVKVDASPDTLGSAEEPGCGCSASFSAPALALLAAVLRARRRSSSRSTAGSRPLRRGC